VRNDLIFGLLDFDQFAELIRLTGFSLADHFGVRLKDTDQLSLRRVAAPESLACLAHHLLHYLDSRIIQSECEVDALAEAGVG
jgi:hypothetical protein